MLVAVAMLICPQCQFENPYATPLCQQCGTSLTLHACSDCGTLVPFTELHCPHCQSLTGQVLRVILAERRNSTEAIAEKVGGDWPSTTLPLVDSFLDANQRYRLLSLSSEPQGSWQALGTGDQQRFFQGSVLDCQPLQPSALARLFEEQAGLDELLPSLLAQPETIPALAYPYLSLQAGFPILPRLHDAWQTDPWQVLLLRDRSSWQFLTDVIASQPLPILQILYWLNEMITLWAAIEPLGLTQSLLIPANLRVDEDQTLGLCQLYPNLDKAAPTIAQLIQFWQEKLLKPILGDAIAPLFAICDRLLSGNTLTLAELQGQLQALADSEQIAIATSPHQLPAHLPSEPSESSLAASLDRSPVLEWIAALEDEPEDESGEEMATEILPMRLFSLSEAGTTECGQQRKHNEDAFGIDSQRRLQQNHQTQHLQARGLYLVCDGMGGHAAGEVASALAVKTLRDYFQEHWQDKTLPTLDVINAGIWHTNQTLYQVNQQNASLGSHRMGTTLVMLLLQDTSVAIAHVGDSRIYRVTRLGGLEQLTVDHEVGQKAIQSGLDPTLAYSQPEAYQLTQALGPLDLESVLPDVQYFEIQEDTLFLLCSDGLSDNNLLETHWETLLLPLLSSSVQLEQGLYQLVEFANQYNGHDNITGILVRLKVRPQL